MTAVERRLKERIRAEGPIPFADFMEEALYGEGGYYNRESLAIGEQGDFVTGSTHSPLFASVTARLLARMDAILDLPRGADYLEAGFGDGGHLAALAEALGQTDRRLLAWDRIRRRVPRGFERLDDLEATEVDGLIFSYELFDALPVHRVIGRPAGLGEMWVGICDDEKFEWRFGELSTPELGALPGRPLEEGQIADLAPGWRPLYRRLAESLRRGLLVTFDYGFEMEKLLDVRVRRHGTLACYRRQRVHRDPFVSVGEQDLTAHVDFTALIDEGEKAGLETVVLSRQAPWLVGLGLLDALAGQGAVERTAAMQLADLEGMGEEIRVLVQARGIDGSKVLPREILEL